MRGAERFAMWFGLCVAAGLGAWLVSLFPHLAAALAGCGTMYVALHYKTAQLRRPTPNFYVTWVGGSVTAALISWMGSIVPPFSCLLAAFLGSLAMYIATFFEERMPRPEKHCSVVTSTFVEEDTEVLVTPLPERYGLLRGTVSLPAEIRG